MIGKAIYSYLTTTATDVAALVGTRVYPELASTQKDYPVIVYEVLDDDRNDARTLTHTTLATYRVNLVCIARNYADVMNLSQKVIAALDNQDGVWGGVVVQGAFLESEGEDVITIENAQQIRFSMKELEFSLSAEV